MPIIATKHQVEVRDFQHGSCQYTLASSTGGATYTRKTLVVETQLGLIGLTSSYCVYTYTKNEPHLELSTTNMAQAVEKYNSI